MTSTLIRSQKQKSALDLGIASSVRLLIHPLFITLGLCSGFTIPASADITSSGDGTIVSPAPGAQPNTINITGGTPQGTNLFHSFGKFDLNNGQTANFDLKSGQPANAQSGANIQNILGRINGGLPSTIDGKIQVTGGNANGVNLYLMNPAGIIFGQNASLNINGAFTATTARAIRFGTGEWFNALGGTNYPAIDPTKPIDFAFTDTPGSIFNAAKLTTNTGQSITLVGGTVISTGDIKTNGGKISIATVQDGKYVRISGDGSILRFDLPIADKTNIDATQRTLARVSLPDLLTGRIDSTATGVTIEGKVVKLVGDKTAIDAAQAAGDTISKPNRPIANGDIITRNLDTSNPLIGGDIYLDSSNAILAGGVTTSGLFLANSKLDSKGGTVFINAQADVKTGRIDSSSSTTNFEQKASAGGNVTLSSKAADIIVDSISTVGTLSGAFNESLPFNPNIKGGDLTVEARAGVFRVIKLLFFDEIPTFDPNLGANSARSSFISINSGPFGKINIAHGGRSFVSGTKILNNINSGQITSPSGFVFLPDDSGSLGLIISSKFTNGSLGIAFIDGVFKDFNGNTIPGSSITAVPRPPEPPPETPKNNPDEQAARQKSKQDCTPSSTAVAANSTTEPNRSEGNASAPSAAPCQLVTGTAGGTLQILNNRE